MADYVETLYSRHHKDHRDAAGRAAAVHDMMRQHEVRVLQPLLDYLSGRNTVRLLGPKKAELRAPTVALELAGPALAAAEALAPHGINAGGGDFYAVRPLQAMGIDPAKGVLRLSFVHYTTKAEVDQLIRALDHVL
jgi:selenocysteine lyase/cysteine desulfurase